MSLPVTAKVNAQGHLEIGGCDIVKLAVEYGTPLYLLDEQTILDQCLAYRSAFEQIFPNTVIAFASKALCTVGLSRLLVGAGLGFDVSSGGELYTVLKAGADPAKIYFHGNNKTIQEIEEGLRAGVGAFMVDNREELANLSAAAGRLQRLAPLIVRVNPGIEAHTHEFIQTGKIDSKFGVPLDQLDDFIQEIKRTPEVKFLGFHAHIGSQILDIKPFIEELKLLVSLSSKYGVGEIDLGGGIGISYLPEQEPLQLTELAFQVGEILRDSKVTKLVLEPGRSIVGRAGVTVYTVGVVKEIPGVRKYLIVDGGMADNPRPILYDAKYEALLGNRAADKAEEKVTVAGRYCESGDILVKEAFLPKARAGDLLVTTCTGAYNYSMSSNYNRVPRPALVMIANGGSRLLVRRESYEDLIANDLD